MTRPLWQHPPACWTWPLPGPGDTPYSWQAGRCAVCNKRPGQLVTDHDHCTGLIRGQLCPSCNSHEGTNGHLPTFRSYALVNPYTVTRTWHVYRGTHGVLPISEHHAALRTEVAHLHALARARILTPATLTRARLARLWQREDPSHRVGITCNHLLPDHPELHDPVPWLYGAPPPHRTGAPR